VLRRFVLARFVPALCRVWLVAGSVSSAMAPVPWVPERLALVELVTVWPEAVCATTSVTTPAPISAASASEWLTRVRRRSAASRLIWARVRIVINRVHRHDPSFVKRAKDALTRLLEKSRNVPAG
jgi:hypothetical protein